MEYKEAYDIIYKQKCKFLDEYVDYGGVAKAYDLALEALSKLSPQKPKHFVYVAAEYDSKEVISTCPHCNQLVEKDQLRCEVCGQRLDWSE